MSESTWKNGKDLIKSKEFYSSVNWDMLSRKPSKSKNETKCECQKEPCADKETCYNMLCHAECEDNCNFAAGCENRRMTKKQVKNVITLNDKDEGLVLISNKQHVREDKRINEHLRLAVSRDKVEKLPKESRNEKNTAHDVS